MNRAAFCVAAVIASSGVRPDSTRSSSYVTGDIMRRNANGFFYFVGRADDMFVCGSENIYPGEVENLLERHPRVAQAIVVPAPDDIKGQNPCRVHCAARRVGADCRGD
jgi:acyl-coenzyme A synthetase/AMP-(fatty) acid ligase